MRTIALGMTLAYKILSSHTVEGELKKGNSIAVHIDYTLTQDATGTMAYLQFEAMGVDRVRTEKSLAYIDHNTLQTGFENADDHAYIASAAKKFGVYCSRPGNGICHQVNLERFGVPGATLLGSDSHTPTGGGIGMIAMGAGGLDVAVAMAGGPYYMTAPEVLGVRLTGALRPGVSAKDVILEVLRRLSVKGGVGKIVEYFGEGVSALTVPERATITNMGAELGATTSVFPSDEQTRRFLAAQDRECDYSPLSADADAVYDDITDIDLGALEPLAACPHSPDNVKTLPEIGRIKVDQVSIGSCTNSSFVDMMRVASILKGKTVAEGVSLSIAPGSKQVLTMLAENGALADMIDAGARILESACGPCIGMGQSPCTDGVSLRTFNRNFLGRTGTKSAKVYLVSPETAAASALTGVLTSVGEIDGALDGLGIALPEHFDINDNMIIPPAPVGSKVDIVRGPNIKPFPVNVPLPERVSGEALLVLPDNITTDHIMPAGAKILPYRSNIPYMSNFCFSVVDESFPERAKAAGGGFIIAGHNYGQGSSREHAALVPLYLGIKAVIAKSFARIHMSNLINSGILPLTFSDETDYDIISVGDVLNIENAAKNVSECDEFDVSLSSGKSFRVRLSLSARMREILLAGGLLNYTKLHQ